MNVTYSDRFEDVAGGLLVVNEHLPRELHLHARCYFYYRAVYNEQVPKEVWL